jgi:hypothetical protein
MKEYIKCKICGNKFKRITASHVKTHGITIKQYQDQFGYSPSVLSSESLLSKYSITKELMIKKYGKSDGENRWEIYRQKQKESNTFKYKENKHGWTREQFDIYNKSRAVTKENCIKRHGKVDGLRIYKEYVEKQRYSGCSVDYFIEKHGEVSGISEYNRVCSEKGHTIDNYIRKYGILGKAKYNEYKSRQRPFYSKISQDMFDAIYDRTRYEKCYYANLNKEYGVYLSSCARYTFIDFYALECNRAIEFYGDYWHCNPDKYDENYTHSVYNETAEDVWKRDANRISALYKDHNISTLVIWQSEFVANREETITKCLEFLDD